jgi:3-deoxy-D-manno-octulosonate 8-phosphate phosphatase (KDO 8-P phosphatase)
MNELIEKARQIKCLICDVDGVLTDGLLYLDSSGNELKTFQVMDGVGLKLLMSIGIEIAVITGSTTDIIDHRMQQLKIKHYFKGQLNKLTAYETLKTRLQLDDHEFAYIGDDIQDLGVIQRVGLGIAIANAVEQVKNTAIWQTQKKGGHGGVREVCDFILNAQDKYALALERYIK